MHKIRHLYHRYQHLISIQNVGLVVVCVVSMTWLWGSVATLQQNYTYQQQVDTNSQRIELMKLQNQNAHYMSAYYKSDEYLELAARQRLGLAKPGERLVILPSSEGIVDTSPQDSPATKSVSTVSPFAKWLEFFFGDRR